MLSLIIVLLLAWFGFGRYEMRFITQFQNPPTIKILTDHPEVWYRLLTRNPVIQDFSLEIESLPRSEWIQNKNELSCSFVSLKSYFISDLVDNGWLSPWPENDQIWWDRLWPDFKGIQSDPNDKYFLPLLWSVTQWQGNELFRKNETYQLLTSVDEALLLAYDLGLPNTIESNTESEDEPESDFLVGQIWRTLQPLVHLNSPGMSEKDKSEDENKDKSTQLTQNFVTSYIEESKPNLGEEAESFKNQLGLWFLGLGVCPQHKMTDLDRKFLNWIFRPEIQLNLVTVAQMASTATVSEHLHINNEWKASSLRTFPLTRLKQRQLPWSQASLWPQVVNVKSN
ncbi:MAG: hypothetical protein K1X29_07295 [Bdellovibrionales bacterium]|nr:hypothetical protein [Bdellovibrionales bacterium]